MQVRAYAELIVTSPRLADKLAPPPPELIIDGRDLRPVGSTAEGRCGSVDGRDLRPVGSPAEGRCGSIDGRDLRPVGSTAEGRCGSNNGRDLRPVGSTAEARCGSIHDAGPPLRLSAPGRPGELAIVPGRQARVPPLAGMRDPAQRARILHALANHELQAIELFAWALLAFPDAPLAFRRGLVAILADEQRHLALYDARLAAHGVRFGDHPVTGHFWNKLDHMRTPVEFACVMGLTFEAANLDFAGDYAAAARACGDAATADALDRVHADEIRHVHFGWTWLRRFAGEGVDAWHAYTAHVRPPLGPARARGARLDREARRRAGFDEAFIARLDAIAPTRPSGEPRG